MTGRTRLAAAAVDLGVVAALALPLWALWRQTGDPLAYLAADMLPGQGTYVASKGAGLVLIVLLWLQAVSAGLRGTPPGRVLAAALGPHDRNGLLVAALALGHPLLFVAAASLRSGELVLAPLLPRLTDYYHAMLTLGLTAAVAILVAAGAGLRRRRHPTRLAVLLHRLAPAAFAAAWLHGWTIGSETRTPPFRELYVLLALSAAVVWAWRLARSIRG